MIYLKKAMATEILTDGDGYIVLIQKSGRVTLTPDQAAAFQAWLIDANGLSAEADWNKGVDSQE